MANEKYADVLGDWLVEMGYTHCFMLAGGGCMHLIDGFRSRFTCIPVVHAMASMGWGLASAVGAAFARPGQRVVLAEGDGSFSQNLQELAIVRRHGLPVKMFLIANGGYASIRATQRKFFQGAYVGCDEATGLGFPDWIALFLAFGIPAETLSPSDMVAERLAAMMDRPGPAAWVVHVDPDQPNFPAVTSRILPDGSMESNSLSRQQPPLPPEIQIEVTRFLPS